MDLTAIKKSLLEEVQKIGQRFIPQQQSNPQPQGNFIRVNGGMIPFKGPQVVKQAQAAQPISEAQFKYLMGQNNYSSLRPQVQKVLKGTPLEMYGEEFISRGNQYGVDPRVLITIANNESSMGRRYPVESYNPFGYIVDPPDYGDTTGLEKEGRIWQGLKNAGFTSMPHAIDRLTGRFQRQPTENYKKFYNEPTIENLQTAYNANPAERDTYLKNAYALSEKFR
jgi:hypothetical protein